MVWWALSLGGVALRGSTGALGVWGGGPGVERTTVKGPAWSGLTTLTFSFLFFLLISIINCFYRGKCTTVLIPRS